MKPTTKIAFSLSKGSAAPSSDKRPQCPIFLEEHENITDTRHKRLLNTHDANEPIAEENLSDSEEESIVSIDSHSSTTIVSSRSASSKSPDASKANHLDSTHGEKKYGLLVSNRKPQQKTPVSILEDEADEENQATTLSSKNGQQYERMMLKHGEASRSSYQVQKQYAEALTEDPEIFDYDAAFDKIQQDRASKVAPKSVGSTAPKYIRALISKADERKSEREIQFERKLQREAREEKEVFGDTEQFVTSAYKEKLLEMQAAEEERKKKEEEEEDVTKKKDMSDFYRNLFKNNVAYGGGPRGLRTDSSAEDQSVKRPRT